MSDIIKCKDCKSFQRWRTLEQAEKFGQVYECEKQILSCPEPDDYCSKAEAKETSDLITQIMCPNCLIYWKNISVPKDIWYNGTFRCPKCGEYLVRQEEE